MFVMIKHFLVLIMKKFISYGIVVQVLSIQRSYVKAHVGRQVRRNSRLAPMGDWYRHRRAYSSACVGDNLVPTPLPRLCEANWSSPGLQALLCRCSKELTTQTPHWLLGSNGHRKLMVQQQPTQCEPLLRRLRLMDGVPAPAGNERAAWVSSSSLRQSCSVECRVSGSSYLVRLLPSDAHTK